MYSGHQTRSVEWCLGAMMVGWGFGLLLSGSTMQLAPYRTLGAIAPGYVWAAWSLSIGALRLLALFVNGAYFRTPLIRAGCSVLGFVWWLVLGFLFRAGAADEPLPATLLWYPVFVFFEGYSVYRGARDSYHTGALRRWRSTQATG